MGQIGVTLSVVTFPASRTQLFFYSKIKIGNIIYEIDFFLYEVFSVKSCTAFFRCHAVLLDHVLPCSRLVSNLLVSVYCIKIDESIV